MSEVKRHSVSGYVRQDICYNDPEGEFVYHDDYADLKAERDALAAENVVLKVSRQGVVNDFDNAMNEFGMALGETAADYPAPETPATDAYLNSVRADGVDMVKTHPAISLCSLAHVCEEIAAKLRAGKDGE